MAELGPESCLPAESACIHIRDGRKESRIAGADPRERREGCPVVSCPWPRSLIHGEHSHNGPVLPLGYGTPESTGSDQQQRWGQLSSPRDLAVGWSQRSAGRAGRFLNPQVSQGLQIPHWHCPRDHGPLHAHTLHPPHLHESRRVSSLPG